MSGEFLSMTLALAAVLFTAPVATASEPDDRAQIEKLVRTEVSGMIARDVGKIMSIYVHSDELMEFDASPPLKYIGWDALRALYEKWLNTFVGNIEGSYADLYIFVSGNLAYGYNIQTWKFNQADGSGYTIVERVTQVYRKVKGHWLIVHEHASLPVDLGTTKAILESD